MIERILIIFWPLYQTLDETSTNINKNRTFMLSDNEKQDLEDVASILSSFNKATEALSGSDYVTVSIVLPYLQALKNELIQIDIKDSDFKKSLKSCFLKSVNYFDSKYNFSNNSFLIAMTFLDPQSKKFMRFGRMKQKI